MSPRFAAGTLVEYAGAHWHVERALGAEAILLRSDTGAEVSADPLKIRLPEITEPIGPSPFWQRRVPMAGPRPWGGFPAARARCFANPLALRRIFRLPWLCPLRRPAIFRLESPASSLPERVELWQLGICGGVRLKMALLKPHGGVRRVTGRRLAAASAMKPPVWRQYGLVSDLARPPAGHMSRQPLPHPPGRPAIGRGPITARPATGSASWPIRLRGLP